MRAFLRKPGAQTAISVLVTLLLTEVVPYWDRGRHSTPPELAILFLVSLVYFGAIERFVGDDRGAISLRALGFVLITSILRRTDNAGFSWKSEIGFLLVVGFVVAILNAAIDDISKRNRDSTTEPRP